MGYHAWGGGSLQVRHLNEEERGQLMSRIAKEWHEEEDLQNTVNMITEHIESAGFNVERAEMAQTGEIDIEAHFQDGCNYWDDEVMDMLHAIEPYLSSCDMEFEGDDDAHWRHVLRDGKVITLDGVVTYDATTRCYCNDADCAYANNGVCTREEIYIRKTPTGALACANRKSVSQN